MLVVIVVGYFKKFVLLLLYCFISLLPNALKHLENKTRMVSIEDKETDLQTLHTDVTRTSHSRMDRSREAAMKVLASTIDLQDKKVVVFSTSQKQADEFKDLILKTHRELPNASSAVTTSLEQRIKTFTCQQRHELPTCRNTLDDDILLSLEEAARIPSSIVVDIVQPTLGRKVEPLFMLAETSETRETPEKKHKVTQRRIYTSEMLQDEYNSPGYIPEWNSDFPMPARIAYFNDKCTIHEIEDAKPIKGSYVNMMHNMEVDVPPLVVRDVVDSKAAVEYLAALTPHLVQSVGRELDDCDFHAIQPCHLGAIQNPLGNQYRQRQFVHYKNKCWLLGAFLVNMIDNFFRNPKLLRNAKNYDWYPICMLGNRRSDGSSIVYDDVYFRFMKLAVHQPVNTTNNIVVGHFSEYNRRVERFEDRAGTKNQGFKSVESVSDDIDDV